MKKSLVAPLLLTLLASMAFGGTLKVISCAANQKEWGPASVGFLFSEAGDSKMLTITYWISKNGGEKSLETLEKIFSRVKTVK
jgi:hypothetical protein